MFEILGHLPYVFLFYLFIYFFQRSASVYPLTHVVNEELVKSVVEQKLDIVSFWKTVVRKYFTFVLL